MTPANDNKDYAEICYEMFGEPTCVVCYETRDTCRCNGLTVIEGESGEVSNSNTTINGLHDGLPIS